mgnify:CR=1 FL=1
MDWYTETGEKLGAEVGLGTDPDADPVPMQLLPSGPGYLTMPNLRLFTGTGAARPAQAVLDQPLLRAR